jgi:hypothetical protein
LIEEFEDVNENFPVNMNAMMHYGSEAYDASGSV